MRYPRLLTAAPRFAILIVAGGIAALLLLDFCDLVYRCGCRSMWNGGAEACNIHQPGVPHCPWCSYGWWGAIVPMVSILISQAVVAFWPRPLSIWLRLLAAVAVFPLAGAVAALFFGWFSGYWGG